MAARRSSHRPDPCSPGTLTSPLQGSATRRALGRLQVDRAIAYTLLGRVWGTAASLATLTLIARYLSAEEQGFYYTFFTLANLQVFLELGMTLVVLQVASHEKAHLRWGPDGLLHGDPVAKARLATLLRRSLLWYGGVSALLPLLVLPAGMAFLSRYDDTATVTWRWPWVLLIVAVAASLLVLPVLSLMEGIGKVADVALVRAMQQVVGNVSLWVVLLATRDLWAASLLPAATTVVATYWAFRWRRPLLDLLATRSEVPVLDWRREVFPFQWRIALSAMSGFFIFQVFSPVAFATQGAEEAGRVGMSVAIATAILITSASWVSTKAAGFGEAIASRDYRRLDAIFRASLLRSVAFASLASVGAWLTAVLLRALEHPLGQRLLGPVPLGLLLLSSVVNTYVTGLSVYLRAHKREPYVGISVGGAILVAASTLLLARSGTTAVMAGYLVLNLVMGAAAGTWLFVRKREQWHRPEVVPDRAGAAR